MLLPKAKQKTQFHLLPTDRLTVLLDVDNNNIMNLRSRLWHLDSLTKKHLWIYNNINDKLKSTSNRSPTICNCCSQKQWKKQMASPAD